MNRVHRHQHIVFAKATILAQFCCNNLECFEDLLQLDLQLFLLGPHFFQSRFNVVGALFVGAQPQDEVLG